MTRRASQQQPEPASSFADAGVSPARLTYDDSARHLGPDIDQVPSDQVDVGADFYTAEELAALRLPGLPSRREHVSRLAARQKWRSRKRGGRREFPLDALPTRARTEIVRRRMLEQASRVTGSGGKPHAPLSRVASLTSRQAERLAAREIVLEEFDAMRGERSARAAMGGFVVAFNSGAIPVDDWVRTNVKRLSIRTLKRWLAARGAGRAKELAGRYRGGRRSVFELSQEAADFVIGAHLTQPLLGCEELLDLLKTNFPQGLPDATEIMLDYPSVDTVRRFIRAWHDDPVNAAQFMAFVDPDRAKSLHRFAAGDAAAGIVRPNQLWQIDASPADVLCSDGRKSIYVVIDVATRRVMALVTDTPKTLASLLLIARACQAWGVPESICTDNGSDFVSKHFRICLRQLDVHHKITPPYSPERKSFIERAIGTIQHKFMRLLPGFIGHSVADRQQIRARDAFAQRLGVSDAEKFDTVALSGEQLQEQLAAWLVNKYAHRSHSGLRGRTPHDVTAELQQRYPPHYASEAALGMLLMPPVDGGGLRVASKTGVRVNGREYWTDRLVPGQRLQVRLDPADAGKVWLYTDTDPWRFVGIGLNPELAGLDRAELAGRVRAQQAEFERHGRAELRRLMKRADFHSVAARMIGTMPSLAAANANAPRFSTPDLEEAAIAAAHAAATKFTRPCSAPEAPTPEDEEAYRAFVADFRIRQEAIEETPEERYARFKAVSAQIDAGVEIPAESRAWRDRYATTPECKALRMIEEEFPETEWTK